MQLGALTDRLTPGQARRRAAKLARRRETRAAAPTVAPTERPRVVRQHLTYADLRQRLFGRSLIARLTQGRGPTVTEVTPQQLQALAAIVGAGRRS
jgi:hypothetical protein